jgi:hypothetical protein
MSLHDMQDRAGHLFRKGRFAESTFVHARLMSVPLRERALTNDSPAVQGQVAVNGDLYHECPLEA